MAIDDATWEPRPDLWECSDGLPECRGVCGFFDGGRGDSLRAVAYSRCMSYLDSLLSSIDGRLDELAAEIDRLEAARTALDSSEARCCESR